MRSKLNALMQVSTVTLTLVEGDWKIDLVLRPAVAPSGEQAVWHVESVTGPSTLALLQASPSTCR